MNFGNPNATKKMKKRKKDCERISVKKRKKRMKEKGEGRRKKKYLKGDIYLFHDLGIDFQFPK